MGCGNNRDKKLIPPDAPEKFDFLVTTDIDHNCHPDFLCDLNIHGDLTCGLKNFLAYDRGYAGDFDFFDEIHVYDVLEHTGTQGDFTFFFEQFAEFHKWLKPGGYFCGILPRYNSVWAFADPGHRRVIPIETFVFLDQDEYTLQVGTTAMTDYRAYWKRSFKMIDAGWYAEHQAYFVLQAIK